MHSLKNIDRVWDQVMRRASDIEKIEEKCIIRNPHGWFSSLNVTKLTKLIT
jgi:hypothetical protein